jgi:solute carrier family 6 GABA transporter-like protein 1
LAICAFLISLAYCTEFGYYLLDGVDRWINNTTLVFAAWAELSFSTSIYRCHDIFSEVGKLSYFIYNAGYFGGMVFGVAVAHAVSPAAGAGVGFGLFVGGTVISILLAKTPTAGAPRHFASNGLLKKIYYLAFYSGNQLGRDLNEVVARGKNWSIPSFWGVLLRYISSPVLAIVFSFSYPEFYTLRNDPVYIAGFALAHIVIAAILFCFIVPRWSAVIVPYERRNEGKKPVAPDVVLSVDNELEEGNVERTVVSSDDATLRDDVLHVPSTGTAEKKEKPAIKS